MTDPAPLIDPRVLDKMRRVRRGLDPQQVAELIDEANRRIAELRAQRDMADEENGRIKNALKDWQTKQYEGTGSGRPVPRPLRDSDPPVFPP